MLDITTLNTYLFYKLRQKYNIRSTNKTLMKFKMQFILILNKSIWRGFLKDFILLFQITFIMNNLRKSIFVFITILTFSISKDCQAQETKFKIIQDNNFEKLLSEKRKINNSFSIYKNFSIQIFHGEKNMAEEEYYEFKRLSPTVDATIIYNNPNYKVVVGNYKNKIDAERNLKILSKKYPGAFLVRLKK